MSKKSFFSAILLPQITTLALLVGTPVVAGAASGTWSLDADGVWGNSANWVSGIIADGVGSTATFGTASQARTVTLDTSRTLGGLNFNYPVGSPAYSILGDGISPATLTLQTLTGVPAINVSTGIVTLGSLTSASSIYFVGNQGFEKTGGGRLVLIANAALAAGNSLSGNILVSAGSINIQGVLNNATVTLGNATLLVGNSGGATTQIKGLISAGGLGTVQTAGNSRSLVLVGDGDYVYDGVFTGGAASSSVNVVATLTGGGSQTFSNIGANYNATTVGSGSLISTSTATSGTPFGIGNMMLGTGSSGSAELRISPLATIGAVSYTGANATVGTTFTYGNGGHLVLDKGAADSLTYTVGNSGAVADSVLVRNVSAPAYSASNGSLIVRPMSGLSRLGTATGERFIVNGGVPVVNGIVNPAIIGRDNDANGSGSFLTYDATNGFRLGAYSASTNINGGTAFSDARVFDASGSSTNVLTADSSVYALRASSTISGAFTLSLGTNTAGVPASVILNGGSINTTTLAFGADAAGLVYTSLAGGSISAAITNTTAAELGMGVTFEGPGVLTLSGANTFRGGAFINDSTVSVSSNASLGYSSSNSSRGQVSLKGGTLRTTASFTLTNRQINLLPGVGDGGGTFDITTGTVTFNSSANSKVIGGLGSLTKTGQGTLLLGGTVDNTYSGGTIIKAGMISVQRSGLLGTGGVSLLGTGSSASTMGTLLIGAGTVVNNAITFSGGSVQRVVGAGAAYSLGTTGSVRSSFSSGITTGASMLEAQTATAQTTMTYSFSNTTPIGVLNDSVRGSDVFSLGGLESGKMFTLQLSLDSVISDGNYLLWYNASSNQWVNAVLGNSNAGTMGLSGFQGDGAYNVGADFVLGYWGYDSANKTVWAVLDHNSEFAIAAVPEPGTTAMVAVGLGMILSLVRRRRAVAAEGRF